MSKSSSSSLAQTGVLGWGYNEQTKMAENASYERVKGLNKAYKEIDTAKEGLKGYRDYGNESLDRQKRLFNDPSYLENTGGYKFTMEQGLKGTTAARSNKSIFSGETLKALTEYSAGLASKTYNDEWTRLQAGITTGMGAEQQYGNLTTTSAEIQAGMGEAKARQYDQTSAALAGEIGFGRQIFGQWSGAFAGASASSSGACWVAEELYGVDDIKTHTIRAYVEKHTNDATGLGDWCRAYIEHGVEWAARIKENMSARMDALPVWEYLYNAALKEGG